MLTELLDSRSYTIADFYLPWGYLIGRIYINKPNTIAQLKRNIKEEIKKIIAVAKTGVT